MLVEVLKETGMKGFMSERLFFPASGILPPTRSRPPAQALPVLFNSHEGMSANELEQLGAQQPCLRHSLSETVRERHCKL